MPSPICSFITYIILEANVRCDVEYGDQHRHILACRRGGLQVWPPQLSARVCFDWVTACFASIFSCHHHHSGACAVPWSAVASTVMAWDSPSACIHTHTRRALRKRTKHASKGLTAFAVITHNVIVCGDVSCPRAVIGRKKHAIQPPHATHA